MLTTFDYSGHLVQLEIEVREKVVRGLPCGVAFGIRLQKKGIFRFFFFFTQLKKRKRPRCDGPSIQSYSELLRLKDPASFSLRGGS